MKIRAKYNGIIDESDQIIKYHFDEVDKSLIIELEVIDNNGHILKNSDDIYWTITQNGVLVDTNDSTRGLKAQLVLKKINAGSKTNPSIITVYVNNKKGKIKARKTIYLSIDSSVTNAEWIDTKGNFIREIDYMQSVTLSISTLGLNNSYVNVNFYTEYDLNQASYKAKIHTGRHELNDGKNSFIFTNNFQVIPLIGKKLNKIILDKTSLKIFIRIYDKDYINLLFDGTAKNDFLTIYGDDSFKKRDDESVNLEKVVIVGDHDPYFSQKYEPCFYEKIEIKEGNTIAFKIFDAKSGNPSNLKSRVEYNIRAKSKEEFASKTIISVDSNTEKCQNKYSNDNNEANQKHHRWKIHENAVFEYDEQSIFEEIVKDKELQVVPTYSYEYLHDDWAFFFRYFMFSVLLPTKIYTGTSPLINIWSKGISEYIMEYLKDYLLKKEIEYKKFPQTHRALISTCRYQHDININLVPDLAWAFHYDYGSVTKSSEAYFKDIKTIHKERGLDKELEQMEDFTNYFYKYLKFTPMFATSFIIKEINAIIFSILKEMAREYAVGFQAYYDFDEKDNARSIINYTQNNPWLGKAFIGGALFIQIIIEVLLCVLTEGASAARYLVKLRKLNVVKFTGKMDKIVDKAEKVSPNAPRVLNAAQNVEQYFAGLSFSGYKAYEFLGEVNEPGTLQVEDRFIFTLIDFKQEISNLTIGEILFNMTPVGLVINTTQSGLNWVLNIQANMNLFNAGKKFINNKRNGKSIGKSAVDAYSTRRENDIITYPIKFIKKGLDAAEAIMIQASDRFLKEVLDTEGRFDIEFGGQVRFNVCIKANNATKTFELTDFLGKNKNQKYASELIIAPEGALYVKVKLEAKTKVNVKAMSILNFETSKIKDLGEISGHFELEGDIYYTRRYHFKSDDTKPYYQDAIMFGGIAGSYDVTAKYDEKEDLNDKKNTKNYSNNFIIMQPNSITFDPVPIF